MKLRNGEYVLIGGQEFVYHKGLKALFKDLRVNNPKTTPTGSGGLKEQKNEYKNRVKEDFSGNKEAD